MSEVAPAPPLVVTTASPEATRAVGRAVASVVEVGDVVVLTGDLGAGKTCLTQGIAAGLDVEDRVTSPTFTLAAVHDGRVRLNHLDVYRLDGPDDALDLDLPELIEQGVTVIEWGERIEPLLGPDRLTVVLRYPELEREAASPAEDQALPGADIDEDRRLLTFELLGPRWEARRPALEQILTPWLAPC